MKNILSLIAVIFLSVSFMNAQEIQFVNYKSGDFSKAPSAAEKKGSAMDQPGANATEWNYGNIENSTTGYRYFKFTNTGSGPLVISAAKGSCGCTAPDWPREPIAPGASSVIKVQFDSKNKGKVGGGLQSKRVTLTSNTDPVNTYLTIKGKVDKEATAEEPAKNPS